MVRRGSGLGADGGIPATAAQEPIGQINPTATTIGQIAAFHGRRLLCDMTDFSPTSPHLSFSCCGGADGESNRCGCDGY